MRDSIDTILKQRHNRTVEFFRLIWAWLPDHELSAMNEVVSEIAMSRQDVTLARGTTKGNQFAGANPAALEDLIHELRQPLSTIDSLAYFLEITSSDETIRMHLQRIQSMVSRAHGILDRSSLVRAAAAVSAA